MYRHIPLGVLGLIFCLGASLFAQQADEPVSKTYRIRFKTVQEFEPLVRAMLSNRGEVKSSEELNLIVVRDRPTYLLQVDSLFLMYDQPAQQFMVGIVLLLGSDDPKAQTTADSSVVDMLDTLYSYSKYESLDKVFIRTEEKNITSFDLAEGLFNIIFQVDYIPGVSVAAPIRFRQFILSEYARDVSGKFLKPVYTSSTDMQENVQQIFAAIKHEVTHKTLILIVTARRI